MKENIVETVKKTVSSALYVIGKSETAKKSGVVDSFRILSLYQCVILSDSYSMEEKEYLCIMSNNTVLDGGIEYQAQWN